MIRELLSHPAELLKFPRVARQLTLDPDVLHRRRAQTRPALASENLKLGVLNEGLFLVR
jgi:hypothetical protein